MIKISKIIFDLDNTLINTERIKMALDDFLMYTYHLSKDEAKEIYQMARNHQGQVIFSRENFNWAVRRKLGSAAVGVEEKVDAFFNNLRWSDFLLPGAVEFIEYCQRENMGAMLISLGHRDWQMEKIRGTGLDRYFSEQRGNLILTAAAGEGKIEAIKRVLGEQLAQEHGRDVVIVNDKPDETFRILRFFSDMVALVRWERSDARYQPEMFTALQAEFVGRVFSSDSLSILQKKLAELTHPEYDETGREINRQ